jgi:hypothetical protein
MADIKKAYTLLAGNQIFALDCKKVEYLNPVGSVSIEPNTYYDFGTINNIKIVKGTTKPDVVNMYIIRFIAGEDLSQVVFDGWGLSWVNGMTPSYNAGKIYEITIVDNFASYINS